MSAFFSSGKVILTSLVRMEIHFFYKLLINCRLKNRLQIAFLVGSTIFVEMIPLVIFFGSDEVVILQKSLLITKLKINNLYDCRWWFGFNSIWCTSHFHIALSGRFSQRRSEECHLSIFSPSLILSKHILKWDIIRSLLEIALWYSTSTTLSSTLAVLLLKNGLQNYQKLLKDKPYEICSWKHTLLPT